jgi:hypothetical protein
VGREGIVDGLDVHRVAEGGLLGRGRQTDACLPERGFSSNLSIGTSAHAAIIFKLSQDGVIGL